MQEKVKYIKLNDGNLIPQVGLGVFMLSDPEECKATVLKALKSGYRHIDTAEIYKNERAVGSAIRESGIPREEIFITTKIWTTNYGYEKTKNAIQKALNRLQVNYIDLVLLHQQYEDYIGAWKALEEAVEEGKVHSIGISNFNQKKTQEILDIAKIKPVVNQVECHPYSQQDELLDFLNENGIKLEAWYPLGHGDKKLMGEPLFSSLAQKYNKSVVQIILRWHIQKGNIVFPKATNIKHLQDNINVFDFELSEKEMLEISELNKNKPYQNRPAWLDALLSKLPIGEKD